MSVPSSRAPRKPAWTNAGGNPESTYTVLMQKIHFIRAEWDSEASVWVATSDDVPGLATEADTLEALSEKLQHLVPELLALNGESSSEDVTYELLARKLAIAHRVAC